MRIIFSYLKSHIYELHAVLAATITFISMMFIKIPIKKWTKEFVERKAADNQKWDMHRKVYLKRCNLIIIALTMALSFFLFTLLSILSPFIHFSMFSAILSGVFALTEYAIVDQFIGGKKLNE